MPYVSENHYAALLPVVSMTAQPAANTTCPTLTLYSGLLTFDGAGAESTM